MDLPYLYPDITFKELGQVSGETTGLTLEWQASRLDTCQNRFVVLSQRLETLAEFVCCSLEAEFLLLQETSVLGLKAFNGLDVAHPHYRE